MSGQDAVGSTGRALEDEGLWVADIHSDTIEEDYARAREEVSAMRQPLTWIAVALMLTGAVMLVADVGVAGLWIAVITIGIALVAIDAYRHRLGQHHV